MPPVVHVTEARFPTTEDESHEISFTSDFLTGNGDLVDRIGAGDQAEPARQDVMGLPGLPQHRIMGKSETTAKIQARGDRLRFGRAARQGRLRGLPQGSAILICRNSLRRLPHRCSSRAVGDHLSELPRTAKLAESP